MAALPYLGTSRQESIINTVSIAATVGLPERVLYSASKGALLSLSRAMAVDVLQDGIRMNCVIPGTTATPWVQRLLDGAEDRDRTRKELEARQPMGRLVAAPEVAFAIANLASPLSGATTGSCVAVDGGLSHLRLPNREHV